jgi:4-carboxymuconolactone decarboxylase
MADEDKRARGAEVFEQVMRFKAPGLRGSPFFDATLEHLFADVWTRPGLGIRERRLVTLTVLIALGHEATLRLHLGAAMRSGDLSDTEIDELLVHVAHYTGWPPAAIASQVVLALRAERDKAASSGG